MLLTHREYIHFSIDLIVNKTNQKNKKFSSFFSVRGRAINRNDRSLRKTDAEAGPGLGPGGEQNNFLEDEL